MTKEQALNFNPEEWVWRRSSGYAGYDHVSTPGDESTWIYDKDYNNRMQIKTSYNKDLEELTLFALTLTPRATPSTIQSKAEEFLDKKYFPITQ